MKPFVLNLFTYTGLAFIIPLLYLAYTHGIHSEIGVPSIVAITAVFYFIISQFFQAYLEFKLYGERLTEFRVIALFCMLVVASFIPVFHFMLVPLGLEFFFIFYFLATIIGGPMVLIMSLIKVSLKISEGLLTPLFNVVASSLLNFIYMSALQ